MARKADVFAGEGSFAGKLKKRREAIEAGDPTGGDAFKTTPKAQGEAAENAPPQVLRRGYHIEREDE